MAQTPQSTRPRNTEADAIEYEPLTPADWADSDPTTIAGALDRVAGGHAGVVYVSATAPTTPGIGQLWYDTSSAGSDATLTTETITGATTLADTHSVVLCNASGGAFTVTLPAVVDNPGRRYYIKKIDSSANAVTIDGDAAETIDEAATRVLRDQYATLAIVSDASEWWIL